MTCRFFRGALWIRKNHRQRRTKAGDTLIALSSPVCIPTGFPGAQGVQRGGMDAQIPGGAQSSLGEALLTLQNLCKPVLALFKEVGGSPASPTSPAAGFMKTSQALPNGLAPASQRPRQNTAGFRLFKNRKHSRKGHCFHTSTGGWHGAHLPKAQTDKALAIPKTAVKAPM
jgi:hypothetical protein